MKGFFTKGMLSLKYIYNVLLSAAISLSSIFFFTFIFLKCSFIYDIFCKRTNLASTLNISQNDLHKNYVLITDFVSSPFTNRLSLPNFNISYTAMIHFFDVKNIFKVLSLIFIFTIFVIIMQFIITRLTQINISYKFLKYVAAELITFCVILIISFIINFNKAFILFHKLLFRNDYWLFDPQIDTVINMLPEEFFFIAALIILLCLLLESILLLFFRKHILKTGRAITSRFHFFR